MCADNAAFNLLLMERSERVILSLKGVNEQIRPEIWC